MPTITLPDGTTLNFDGPVTGLQIAQRIGARLAKDALGAKVNGVLSDLSAPITSDAAVSIVTPKKRDGAQDPDALLLIRHSAAHVMAEAIGRIVPEARLVYGPPLENGFYYDIRFPDQRPLRESDLPAIEAQIAKIIAEDRPFTRYQLPGQQGLDKLTREGSKYKLDNAQRALAAAPEADLSFYATGTPGTHWEDLCRGPHAPSTGRIGAVKVTSLASSYWHGDETSDRLTRVYGTAFATKAELDAHLAQLEQAKARDHRVIGAKLHLFHIDEDVGQGLVLWTPAGGVIRQELQSFISAELARQGYAQVFTPHIGRLELYKTSGHFPYYKDAQFAPIVERDDLDKAAAEGCSCAELSNRLEGVSARFAASLNQRTGAQTIAPDRVLADDRLLSGFLLKPMNCPHHVKIFASRPHSYRDLPVRLAEFGTVYRWEQSGELSGMLRVRCFTQDDAHLFCAEDQLPAELIGCLDLVRIIFGTLGMRDYRVRLGLRNPDSSKYTGTPDNWDKAEQACREAARSLGVPFSEEPGEAAFYGPKIDFVVKDVIGRSWQLGTVQVDYNLPIRFDLTYTGPDNKPHRPVMIHRAPFGSMERFCGFLIEHFAGAFPTWLAPEQAAVLPISEKTNDYAASVHARLKALGVRATLDLGNDRIQGKIKAAAERKVPYLLVVGPRDAEHGAVSPRVRGADKDLPPLPVETFLDRLTDEIRQRKPDLTAATG
ncbi:MAG: threonine--tRNA ligase [Planctomyces sp.]|nr:threonine--tRNA ligase [Planctomyces sp.]MBA4039531.1 threonine--tRNA ligase [Planctomyces sp.]MBA4119996.1 threonine--tRNA ligase [Isosphaera sp.]